MNVTPPDNSKPAKIKPAARRKARTFAMQALYQRQIACMEMAEVEAQFRVNFDMRKADVSYFHLLTKSVAERLSELDALIGEHSDIKITDLDAVELNILRIGTLELTQCIEVPYRVVINEGIELAKRFGGDDSHKFVNGVLDRIALKARGPEVSAHHRSGSKRPSL